MTAPFVLFELHTARHGSRMELTPTPAFTSGALELLIQNETANVQNERSPCLTRLLEESIVARGLPFEPIGMLAALVHRLRTSGVSR
jgi:hypothetical protein